MPDSFLGKGWSFPPTFNKASSSVNIISDEQSVESSLQVLLATRKGERIMLPGYGCNLDEMVFEPMTTTFKTYMRESIKTAILFYEPRIELDSIKIDDSRSTEGVILIVLGYTIRTTNSRFNFVYPYYKKEGTDIR